MRSSIIYLLISILLIKSLNGNKEKEEIQRQNRIYRTAYHSNADENNWKFNAVITFGKFVICSGVLVRPKWVLSTATCFLKNNTILPEKFGPLSVRIGAMPVTYMDWNLISIEELDKKQIVPSVEEDDLISIDMYMKHPDFRSHYSQLNKHDIALGKLLRDAGDTFVAFSLEPVNPDQGCRTGAYRSMVTTEEEAVATDIGALQEFTGSPMDYESCKKINKLLGNKTHPIPETYLHGKFCILFGNTSNINDDLNKFGMQGVPTICEAFQGISCVLSVQSINSIPITHQFVEVFFDISPYLSWIQTTLKKQGEELDFNSSAVMRYKSSNEQQSSPGFYHVPSYYLMFFLSIIINIFV